MIAHPMAGLGVDDSGDFSTQEIVDSVGGYGDLDHPAFHELSGDFGTLGVPQMDYDAAMYGDNDDMGDDEFDGMGRRKRFKVKIKKPNLKKMVKQVTKNPLKAVTAPLSRVTAPVMSVAKRIVPKQAQALVSKPAGLTAMAARKFRGGVKKKLNFPKKLKKGFRFGAKKAKPKMSVPVAAAALATVPAMVAPMVSIPEVAQAQVVSTGGQISQQKINAAENRTTIQQAGMSSRRFNPTLSHPMLAFSTPMGEDNEMGFDFKSLLSDVKAKAQAEINKLRTKAEADLKARAGQALSNVGSSILNKPEVQNVLTEQAKNAALQTTAQKIAEAIKDPEMQKKAAIGGVAGLALLGGLAYLAFKRD